MRQVFDLSHPLSRHMAAWPGVEMLGLRRLTDYDAGYRTHTLTLGEDLGTHLDLPRHFFATGRSAEQLGPAELVAPLAVIELPGDDPDRVLTVAMVEAWEAERQRLPEGSIVVANSGWHHRFDDPQAYQNRGKDGRMHFPGFGLDAAELLLERGVTAIGIDTLSLDVGPSHEFEVHTRWIGAGRYQLENLTGLDPLPAWGATIVVGALPLCHGTQAPARVLALTG